MLLSSGCRRFSGTCNHIHVVTAAADSILMTVSGTSSSYISPALAEQERGMLALKKQQDASKAIGQALVGLIATPAANGNGTLVNAFA